MRTSDIRRGRRATVAAVLGLACAPVAVEAQVLFSDNFDTDTVSRYNVFSFDNSVSTTNVVAGTGTNDVTITPQFNYSTYTYRHVEFDEFEFPTTVYHTIPQAPRTTTGQSLGLRLDANNTSVGGTGTAIINMLPKVTEFAGGTLPSGNYKLTVDVWVNYNGAATGGTGSTEFMVVGLNQQNPGPNNGLVGPVITNPTVQQKGSAIAINGETGTGSASVSGGDYRIYTDNSRLGDFDSSTGYAAGSPAPNISGSDGFDNTFYHGIFPAPAFESKGGPGKHWITLEAKFQDGVTYYSVDAHLGQGMKLIATHTDRTSTSGNVALGYADLNGGVAALENSGPISNVDASFVIYDNLVIESLGAVAAQPTWTGASGTWSNGANWAGGTPNSATSVATFGASAAGGTVTVDGSKTVREVVFDNTGMTLGGSGPLVMDSPGATGGDMGVFTVKQGSHTVSAPVTPSKNTLFHVEQAGSTLTLSQPMANSTSQITKSGAGTVVLQAASKNGGITMLGGTIKLAPNSGTMSIGSMLIVGSIAAQRGTIDIDNNKLVLDYRSDADATFITNQYLNLRETIRGAYVTGSGNWAGAGLTSSLAVNDPNKIMGIGYWEASTLTGVSGSGTANWFGQTVDATSFLVAATYMGDLNFDGDVDGDDFALIDLGRALYTSTPVGIVAQRARWVHGDLNYDGIVAPADYAIMDKTFGILHPGGLSAGFLAMRRAEFGDEYVASLLASIPEPSSLSLVAIAAGGLVRRRRR